MKKYDVLNENVEREELLNCELSLIELMLALNLTKLSDVSTVNLYEKKNYMLQGLTEVDALRESSNSATMRYSGHLSLIQKIVQKVTGKER